jgi:hypothetical protein
MHIAAGLLHVQAEIQFEEKKVHKSIREAAKRGDVGICKASCTL